jgi:RNA polymerase sigma factor (sigma-70 family)
MDLALSNDWPMTEQDRKISEAIARDEPRLRRFIRNRVADRGEAEDILQDVFYELVEAYRMMKPVEQVTAWLFKVARNRIIDLFRKKQREASRTATEALAENGEPISFEDLLPSPDAGPDAVYTRNILLEELEHALDELPKEQSDVFIAHELMGNSFKDISEQTGVGMNTLLSRKRYAVKFLRERLRAIYDEFEKE